MTLLVAALSSIGLVSVANAAATNFNYTFDLARDPSRNPSWETISTSASPTVADYFYRLESSTTWVWQNGSLYTSSVTTGFSARNLWAGDVLDETQSLDTFSISVGAFFNSGLTDRENDAYYIGLLNENGAGYMVEVTRSGTVTLSEISGGMSGTWTQLTQGTFNADTLGSESRQTLALSFTGTSLSFQNIKNGESAALYTLETTIGDPVEKFDTVILGAKMTASGQAAHFRDIILSGTVIPETTSFGTLIGTLMILVTTLSLRNRKK